MLSPPVFEIFCEFWFGEPVEGEIPSPIPLSSSYKQSINRPVSSYLFDSTWYIWYLKRFQYLFCYRLDSESSLLGRCFAIFADIFTLLRYFWSVVRRFLFRSNCRHYFLRFWCWSSIERFSCTDRVLGITCKALGLLWRNKYQIGCIRYTFFIWELLIARLWQLEDLMSKLNMALSWLSPIKALCVP